MNDYSKVFLRANEIVVNGNDIELYIATHNQQLIEIDDDRIEVSNKFNSGIACRKFYDTHISFSYVDGIGMPQIKRVTDMDNILILPARNMSCDEIDNICDSDNIAFEFEALQRTNEISSKYRHDYCALKRALQKKGISIVNCALQRDIQLFSYMNSNNVSGIGRKRLFASSVEIEHVNRKGYDNSYIFNLGVKEEALTALADLVSALGHVPEKNNCLMKMDYIRFSNLATSKLLFFFTNMLTIDAVLSKRSFLNTFNKESIALSSNLTIIENSTLNQTITEGIDCEGTEKREIPIVQSGRINNLISGIRDSTEKCKSTGSAYRGDHRQPPYAKPTKIAVLGSKTDCEIVSEFDSIYISDLHGIEQSLDPLTTRFSAVANIDYCENGIIHKTNRSLQINTSILELFSNIVEISNTGVYGVDGSIFSGTILVENRGCIKTHI
jgi:predicted Zn-dependent protease